MLAASEQDFSIFTIKMASAWDIKQTTKFNYYYDIQIIIIEIVSLYMTNIM